MRVATLDVLRCPYCGGRLELVTTMFNETTGDDIRNGVLGCHCCLFPVVDGIPVLHLLPPSTAARELIEQGQTAAALQRMVGFENERDAAPFAAAAAAPASTYRDVVESLGPNFEGGYFLYRFSDPTFIVANAVVRAAAGTVLEGTGRAVDICGGSGHLTRALMDLSSSTPVLADLYFAKVWLARRFTAPGCEPICCDGNAPLPFARGAFTFAMCSDAFQYIWTKRQFVGEMLRIVDAPGRRGAAVINHTHNQLAWSPSHGQPLAPAGYMDLFETIQPRIFAEGRLFADVVGGGPLDLSRRDALDTLNADPALTIVASTHEGVFQPHDLEPPGPARGEYRINPLYAVEDTGNGMVLRLKFPTPDYEDEYGACRKYLPDELKMSRTAVEQMRYGVPTTELNELLRRRIVVDLPTKYY